MGPRQWVSRAHNVRLRHQRQVTPLRVPHPARLGGPPLAVHDRLQRPLPRLPQLPRPPNVVRVPRHPPQVHRQEGRVPVHPQQRAGIRGLAPAQQLQVRLAVLRAGARHPALRGLPCPAPRAAVGLPELHPEEHPGVRALGARRGGLSGVRWRRRPVWPSRAGRGRAAGLRLQRQRPELHQAVRRRRLPAPPRALGPHHGLICSASPPAA
mmetsp:Transcript_16240/g.61567  ORF Transcript_16240/g.61567 Transcript_16240/m.61567 type:complete len:210 (+) Transcript_16240:1237-1866(+)